MTTILPEKNKAENRRQYLLGFVSKFIGALVFISLLYLVFQTTVYYSIKFEKTVLENEYNDSDKKERKEEYNKYENVVNEAKLTADLFDLKKDYKSDVLKFLSSVDNENIKMTISTVEDEEDFTSVDFVGVASDRSSLLIFKEALEDNEKIENLDFPPSTFTKTFDISFDIKFNYKHD